MAQSPRDDQAPPDELAERIAARRRRHEEARLQGDRPFFRSLGIVGGLGWIIVLPMLAGLALGRWLDHVFASGIFWTGALLIIGLAIGCRWAWQRVHRP